MMSAFDRICKLTIFSLLWCSIALKANAVDMYVSSTGNNTIYSLKENGSYTVFNNTIASPIGLTYGDNTFFVNSGGTKIVKLSWNGIVSDFITTGLANPTGITYGPDGYLYIADSGSNSILRADSNGTLSTYASSLNNPRSIAFDLTGNLYVTNGTALGSITKFTPGGIRSTLASGLSNPYAITFASDNNLYVTTQGDSAVYSVSLTGTTTLKGSGIASPTGVYRATTGELRVASATTGTIYTVFSVAQVTPFSSGFTSPAFISVPEPSTYILTTSAFALLGYCRLRKKK